MTRDLIHVASKHTDLSRQYDCHATSTRVHFRLGSIVIEACRFFRVDTMPSADVKIEVYTSAPFAESAAPDFWRYIDPRAPRGWIDRAIVEAVEIAAGLRLPPEPRPIEPY